VPALSFEETYPEKSKEMKLLTLEYIKTLKASRDGPGPGPGSSGVEDAGAGVNAGTIALEDGFPIAPRVILGEVSKQVLEPLYRMYITHHYGKCLIGS
jgi:hypothetical protein